MICKCCELYDYIKSMTCEQRSRLYGIITKVEFLSARSDYFLCRKGANFTMFLRGSPEFNTPEFMACCAENNKAALPSDQLDDLAKHEILRLASEFTELKWRFPEVFGKEN